MTFLTKTDGLERLTRFPLFRALDLFLSRANYFPVIFTPPGIIISSEAIANHRLFSTHSGQKRGLPPFLPVSRL